MDRSEDELGSSPAGGAATRRSWLRPVRNLALALAGFLISNASLEVLQPKLGSSVGMAKLEHLQQHKDEYNALFVGSSRTYRGFAPKLFDELMAQSGVETHTYNMGVPGHRAPGLVEVLRVISEMEPANLRWVFIDSESLDVVLRQAKQLDFPSIRWHRMRDTLVACRWIWLSDMELGERVDRIIAHASSWAYRTYHVGALRHLVLKALGRAIPGGDAAERRGEEGEGYRPYDLEPVITSARRNEFLAELDQFQERARDRAVAARRAEQDPEATADLVPFYFLREMDSLVERLGAEAIFVIQPTLDDRSVTLAAHHRGDIEVLLRYDNPALYPGLYNPKNRWDESHLNPAGAELFTRLIARDFLRHLRRAEGVR